MADHLETAKKLQEYFSGIKLIYNHPFEEASTVLNEVAAYYRELMDEFIAEYSNSSVRENTRFIEWALSKVQVVVDEFSAQLNTLKKHTENNDLGQQKTLAKKFVEEQLRNRSKWMDITSWVRGFILRRFAERNLEEAKRLNFAMEDVCSKFGEIETLQERSNAIDEAQTRIEDQQGEVDLLVGRLATLLESVRSFKSLGAAQTAWGWIWLICLTTFLFATGLLAKQFFFDADWNIKNLGTGTDAIAAALQRVAVLAIPLTVVRICLTKFNTSWHLATIYQHRIACLMHFDNFEKGIVETNPELVGQLRLELAKMIFDDPATGLVKQTEVPDVNITSIAGKVANQ